jgi:hypothetical protein
MKFLECDRQISACDHMEIGTERCASITGFIVGKRDNAISNRDRQHAAEWREIAAPHRRMKCRPRVYRSVRAWIKAQIKAGNRRRWAIAVKRLKAQSRI